MDRLAFRGACKAYPGGIEAARSVDLEAEGGELFAVVGPSGSGKSTLLRLAAGLESLDSGSIWLGGRRIDPIPPRDRGVAMVFQEPVLYPHLDTFGNVAFGLRARRVPRGEVRARVESAAGALGIADLLGRSPSTLSGGQRRRVSLARALVARPRLLLLDEPFSGLDAPLRASVRAEVAAVHREAGSTTILVTHDQAEALALADRMAVFDAGRVVQVGRPVDVHDAPNSPFVARFVGSPPMSLIPCALEPILGRPGAFRVSVEGAAGIDWAVEGRPDLAARAGRPALLGLRADHASIVGEGDASTPHRLSATVDRVEPGGHDGVATLRVGPHRLVARVGPRPAFRPGDRVEVAVDLSRASWFDPADDRGSAGQGLK